MENFYIIDGNSLINRAFYALPLLKNNNGEYSNAVYGFCNILTKLLTENKVDYLAVAFDLKAPTFRHLMCDFYKATRKGMPDELASQMPLLKEMLKLMNITILEKEGFEADDIIGSLSKKFNVKSHIITGDRDSLQLINQNVDVFLTRKGISEIEIFDEEHLKNTMGILPYQVVEMKALMGDSSDNIPGVKGIGEKTALNLIQTYNNVENVYAHIEEITGKTKEKLTDGQEMAKISKTLATICCDVEIQQELEDFRFEFPFSEKVAEFFKKYDFKSILKRENLFKETIKKEEVKEIKVTEIKTHEELENFVQNLTNFNPFSIVLSENFHFSNSFYEEYIIKTKTNLLDNGLTGEEVLKLLKPVLENEKVKKITYDYKTLKHELDNFGINLKGVIFDTQLAIYITNGGVLKYKNVLNYVENKNYNKNNLASCIYCEYPKYLKKLKEDDQEALYFNIELPLIDVLFDMEKQGIKLNREELIKLNEKYNKKIDEIKEKIYNLSGVEFNLNSPKQVAEVLYEKLNIRKIDKNSTSAEVLEELKDEYEIVSLILEYRKYYKLNNTYVLSYLDKTTNDNWLVHSVFNQTLTNTGRLSCTEPNLQNIPIKDEEGRELRKIFISSFENGKIISADYNQIELRLLAHFSQDEKLVSAFKNGLDIHAKTASEIFGVSLVDVTKEMRSKAKAVNFGIIYGISGFGLGKNIKTSRKQGEQFIEKYLQTYPKVQEFMNNSLHFAETNGYVKTLFNRRRYIEELFSHNKITKKFGERVAFNMPLQGTASDIIKIAMLNVSEKFKELNLKSKLIIQIHDELVVDTSDDEVSVVHSILKDEMENVCKLNVPLICEIKVGNNLFEAK